VRWFDWLDGSLRVRDNSQARGGAGDVFAGRLLKLIPAEAMLIYPIGKAGSDQATAVYWPFFVGLVIVLIRLRATREKPSTITAKPGAQYRNIAFALATFFLWVLANGDPVGGLALNVDESGTLVVWSGLGWIAWMLAAAGVVEKD
tara:strand:+ start:855 stop:1292 length:438 start_codon:yes stop_codon:yes gene_type:complete